MSLRGNSSKRVGNHNDHVIERMLEETEKIYQKEQEKDTQQISGQLEEYDDDTVEMVITLEGDRTASLIVRSDDDPVILAKKFCFKHNVDPGAIQMLAGNIKHIQNASFASEKSFKIQRNQHSSIFDDKENKSSIHNISNISQDFIQANSHSKNTYSHKTNNQKSTDRKANCSQNEQNTTMMSQNNNHPYSVFDRLYQDSKMKNMMKHSMLNDSKSKLTSANKSVMNQSSSTCLQIYQKNTKLKDEVLRRNQLLFEFNEEQKVQKCAFKPKINPISDLIARRLRENNYEQKKYSQSQEKQMLKIKEYLHQKQEKQMQQCTFEPKILQKSRVQSTKTERYLLLHDDHNLRETKKRIITQQIQQQSCQKPKINKISESIVNGKQFFQRLEEDQNKRMKNKQIQQSRKHSAESNRRPSTGRAPASRNKGQKTIGQYLYEKRRANQASTPKQPPMRFTGKKSDLLYEQNKSTAFHYMFTLMDSDEDGLISGTKINIDDFPQHIIKLIAPLLSQMEEIGAELNEQEFMEAINRLFESFNVQDKNTLLKVYRSNISNSRAEQLSFHPSINDYSIQIANDSRDPSLDLYELSKYKIAEKEAKLNELRALKLMKEYEECTFQPQLFR